VPAAYTLARRNFVGKRLLMLLFLLPLMVPPITYGIPRHRPLQGAARRHDLRCHPCQSDTRRAVRDPGDDSIHRADRSQPRIGGARVRRAGVTLARMHASIVRPGYDPRAIGIGIVHLGIGAFYRAQAPNTPTTFSPATAAARAGAFAA
jgi:hypothetical protein